MVAHLVAGHQIVGRVLDGQHLDLIQDVTNLEVIHVVIVVQILVAPTKEVIVAQVRVVHRPQDQVLADHLLAPIQDAKIAVMTEPIRVEVMKEVNVDHRAVAQALQDLLHVTNRVAILVGPIRVGMIHVATAIVHALHLHVRLVCLQAKLALTTTLDVEPAPVLRLAWQKNVAEFAIVKYLKKISLKYQMTSTPNFCQNKF
jgi:hypothetical protein